MSNVKNSKLPKSKKTLNFLNFKNLSKRNEVRKEMGIHYRLSFVKNRDSWTGVITVEASLAPKSEDTRLLPVMNFY